MHMRHTVAGPSVPWVTFDVNVANDIACKIASETNYCAMVKGVDFPREIDTEKYAMLADGETKFTPT
jgi:hypothetical protein